MQHMIENNLGYVNILNYQTDDLLITPQTANTSEDHRIKYIVYLRSLIRLKNLGKPIPENIIYNNLISEMSSDPHTTPEGSPGRLFEFIPVQLRYRQDYKTNTVNIKLRGKYNSEIGMKFTMDKFRDNFLKFSFSQMIAPNEYILNTTLRTCINGGIPYSYIPYNTPEELQSFKAVELYCPTFIISRIVEHTQLSKELEYDKNISTEEYWYPDKLTSADIEHLFTLTTPEIIPFLKSKGINRDIYSSGLYGWKKRRMIISGWDTKYTWRSLFLDKNALTSHHSNFTPKEVSTVIKAIKETLFPSEQFII